MHNCYLPINTMHVAYLLPVYRQLSYPSSNVESLCNWGWLNSCHRIDK